MEKPIVAQGKFGDRGAYGNAVEFAIWHNAARDSAKLQNMVNIGRPLRGQ
jgi:hypothetical protein